MRGTQPNDDRYVGALRRGAAVNALGLISKLGAPLLVLVVTRLFGPAITGVFLLTYLLSEIARSAAVDGYFDAVTILGSRALARTEHGSDAQEPYAVIGASLRAALVMTLALAAAALLFAGPLSRLFAEQRELDTAIRFAGASLPLIALGQIAIAATKMHLRMEYDVAVWGFGRPMALLLASASAHSVHGGLYELMLGFFLSHVLLAAASLWAFARFFEIRPALHALLHARALPGLHRFAIPQSLNMAFGRFQARMDVLVLGMLDYPSATIAFYTTGALIAGSLQEVRMVFSSVLAPVVGRLHDADERATLEELMARITRWTTSLVVPLCALLLIWRADLLRLVDASYVQDSDFFSLLLLSMLINCSLGLAGNYLVSTGHTGFNLFNSLLAAVLNTLLSLWLIPRHGLIGAAAATCLSSLAVAIAQLVEVRVLEGIRLLVHRIYKPYVALAVQAGLAVAFWDRVQRGGALVLFELSVLSLSLYLATLLLLRHEELVS